MRLFALVVSLSLALLPKPTLAQDTRYVPDRRFVLTEGTDLTGTDLQSVFDTTLDSCESACLANAKCMAITFNSKANSCFLKSAVSDQTPYEGAYSGWVRPANDGAAETALARAGELAFLSQIDFDQALQQARSLAHDHITGDWTAEDLLASATDANAQGDYLAASRAQGAALNITDAADQWVTYADMLLSAAQSTPDQASDFNYRALSASANGYLRSDNKNLQATALVTIARALEANGRGRDMIPTLQLAQDLAPRDDTAAMLDDAIGKYGFNIAENRVDTELAQPRICVTFNASLIATGTDYATFVQLPESGLAVDASDSQICVSGVEHGKRYSLTFRKGLPAASGETLAKDITITAYVRDRAPGVRFPGRAYILPRAAANGIPVETTNTTKLNLTLQRISDRNLVRAFAEDYVGRPLDYWSADYFANTYAEKVWTGTADTAQGEANRDITTNLPLDDVLKDLGPGIYLLQASVPDTDPEQIPPAMQWFVISDLGMTTMQGTDGLHLFVRSLNDASAKSGAKVTLVSRANAVIASAMTDDQGYALFTPAQVAGTGSSAPALVTVEQDQDYSFLSLTDPEFDLSDRGVEGRPSAPAIDVFLATDRGAYRAGETLNATILARDPSVKGIEGLPLTARLIRPDGVEYSRVLAADAGGGGRAVSFPLEGSAPRGTWRIEVFAEDEYATLASEAFLVEDFLPERIDFALTLPEGPMSATDEAQIGIAARYLFGAPGADLPIEGDYRITAADGLADWPGYRFGKYNDSFSPYYDSLYDAGQTDAEGNSTLFVTLPDLGPNSDRPLAARYAVRLTEGSGRPVERTIERPLFPAKPFIGIKPAFKDGVAAENADAAFDLIALGPDGKPAAMAVHWALNRVETHYQWYSLYGQWNWDVTTSRTTVAEGDASLGSDPVAVKGKVDWGQYELVVIATDGSQAVASTDFYAGWYVPVDAVNTPDTLDIALDKSSYKSGDTAQVHIVPRSAGVALITVMSNHLITMKAVEVAEGENTIDLPVTDDWGAGAYVTASVLRPMDVAAGRTPSRALGLSYAKVDPGAKRLTTTIEAAAESNPRAPLPVAVKVDGVAAGEHAYVTLAAVDVGILNLTATLPPDPEDHYFGQQKLGMAIRDIYGRLIDGQNGTPGTVRSGGDAGGVKLKSPPPTEELVAYFSGPIPVDADGYARTEFAMPSFNGTVKLMAIAWSKSSIGQANQDVLVRDPVVVTASVARFLAPGDQSTLRLEIVHASGPSGRMGLDVTGAGVTLGATPSGVDLADKGKETLTIPLTAPDSEGNTTLRVALTTPDGKQLVKTLTVPVQANDPETLRQSQFTLAPGKEFTLDANVFAGFIPGSGKATLALGPIARFNAPGILASLDRYPYGCTEQMTSKALPLLYFEDIASAMGAAGDTSGIRDRVQQAIGEILLNQSASGSFGLWYPDTGDMWLDAYVTDFLSRAKAQGYQVPDTAFRNALDNLRNQINYQSDFDRDSGGVAYSLMVLAHEGAAAIGDLRYYADVKAAAFDTPIAAAQLGAALASYGDQTRADAMFRQAATLIANNALVAETQVWRADYGTNLRDATALLALGTEAGSTAFSSDQLGQSVAASLLNRSLSTQEATWALLATHALIDGKSADQFTLNGAPLSGPLVRVIEDQTVGGASQTIANAGQSDATLTLTTFGVPAEPEPAGGNGYKITRSWFTMEGAPVSLDAVKQGTRMVAVLEVTPLGTGEARLMVNDPLPAGFEIDNPNLIRGGDIAALDWLTTMDSPRTTEFRQERFLAAVDWTSSEPFRLAYVVRAISPGSYRLPAASVEDMYRPDYRARTDSGRVTVTE